MRVMIVTRIDFEICNLQFYMYIKNRGTLHTAYTARQTWWSSSVVRVDTPGPKS